MTTKPKKGGAHRKGATVRSEHLQAKLEPANMRTLDGMRQGEGPTRETRADVVNDWLAECGRNMAESNGGDDA